MKRFKLLAAASLLAASLGSTAALAQPYPGPPPGPPPGPGYGHPPGPPPGYHHWHHGDHFHGDRYVVNDWHHRGFRPPPHGYEWVRGDNGQYLLIAVASGVIADVLLNSR